MEHTCYFLLCKPPPPPCLFMLNIPISDILPLVPSKSFTHQDISMETKTKGTKRLCARVSLWCRSCALCFMSALQCGIFILSLRQVSLESHPFSCQLGGELECSLCWLFAQDLDRKEAVHPSEARSLFKSKPKRKRKKSAWEMT